MKKLNNFKKIFVGAALLTTMVLNTNSVMASGNLIDGEEFIGTVYDSQTFSDGTTITTIEGQYDVMFSEYQRMKFKNIMERRLYGTLLRYDVDSQNAVAYLITGPKGVDVVSPDKTLEVFGNLDVVDQVIGQRFGWETIKYEGWGHVNDPKGEARISYHL